MKLIAALMLSLTACMSHARPAQRVETPDPVVGDLKCSHPRLTTLQALYGLPADSACEPNG